MTPPLVATAKKDNDVDVLHEQNPDQTAFDRIDPDITAFVIYFFNDGKYCGFL